MHHLFRLAVERSRVPHVLISGDRDRRFAAARQAIERILNCTAQRGNSRDADDVNLP
jgi:hypothetical protein